MTEPMAVDEIQARNAALIITFYGPCVTGSEVRLESVTAQVVERLSLQPAYLFDYWQDLTLDHEVFLQRFDPAGAADTTAVQLSLNAPGAASTAWDAMRGRLEAILDEGLFKPVWGYSMIYQAETIGTEPGGVTLKMGDPLLQAARRPAVSASVAAWAQPLAKSSLPGGAIWLVDVPKYDGLSAATVYLALSTPDTGNQLVAQHLCGPGATLMMPDLIAHKGYYQARQYQVSDFQDKYMEKLHAMQATTHILLHQLGDCAESVTRLEDLAHDYDCLVDTLSQLERLRIALARQLHNYCWWQREAMDDQVLQYHHTFLETALAEIQLLIQEGKGALEGAGTAVEMIQARLNNERQRQQEILTTILAVLAVVLALPQILDRDVVRAILIGMGIPVGDSLQGTVWLFGVQTVVILLVMIVARLFMLAITRKQKERR